MSGYQYQGRPGWPFDPASRDDAGGKPAGTPERARRLAEFARYRSEGLSITEAGAALDPPVGVKTAYTFERDRKRFAEPAS